MVPERVAAGIIIIITRSPDLSGQCAWSPLHFCRYTLPCLLAPRILALVLPAFQISPGLAPACSAPSCLLSRLLSRPQCFMHQETLPGIFLWHFHGVDCSFLLSLISMRTRTVLSPCSVSMSRAGHKGNTYGLVNGSTMV